MAHAARPDIVLRTPAWLLEGMTGSQSGTLRLANGRFAFVTDDGREVFDVPLREVGDVRFPWYYFGGGMKVAIGNARHRFSFLPPVNTGGDVWDIRSGRQAGKEWKGALGA